MNSENLVTESNRRRNGSILWILGFIVAPTIVAVVGGTIVLVIEYKTGYFQQSAPSGTTSEVWGYLVALTTSAMIVCAVMGMRTLRIWFRHHQHFREDFALCGTLTILVLIPMTLAFLVTGIMPWYLPATLYAAFSNTQVGPPVSSFEGYLLLIMTTLVLSVMILKGYRGWNGQTSIDQYQAEQRGETIGLFSAGFRELRRIFGRRPPLQAYRGTSAIEYVSQLEPVIDTLAWSEHAKELLRLSSSAYTFDPNCDWHDRPGCWLGSNAKTGDLVCLIPAHEGVNNRSIGRSVEYAERIASREGKQLGEVVVAVKSGSVDSIVEWGGRTIRVETESNLLNSLVDLRDYENEIRKRVLVDSLLDSELVINDVYVQSRFVSQGRNQPQDNIEGYLREWLDEPGRRQLAILGEYGQGKSTTALMFTYHLLCEGRDNGRIPILIELRGRNPSSQTPLRLLGDWAAQYRMDPQALMQLLISGRLVVIFDGFDEMALVGDLETRLRHFSTLWSFCYPKAKILITGRPNFFLDNKEMNAALGISKPMRDRAYCEAIRLVPFNIEQIYYSLYCFSPSIRVQICSLAEHNPRFRDIISRPSLLHIVAALWKRENLSARVDSLTSAYIMDQFIRHSYSRQGLLQEELPQFTALTTAERDYFMRGIATYMVAQKWPNQISGADLNRIIVTLIDYLPDSVSLETTIISQESRQPLRSRLAEADYGLEHVQIDVRACGLLVDDPTSPGTFRFGHKSFMEYLYAAVVAEYISKDAPVTAKAILNATRASAQDILSLPNSVGFLSEIVTADVTNHPVEAKQLPESDREYRFVRRSFKSLASNSGASFVIARIRLFDRAYGASLQCLSRTQQIIFGLFRPRLSVPLVLALSLGIVLNVLRRRTSLASLGILDSLWLIVLVISGIVMLAVVLALLFFRKEKDETHYYLHDPRRKLDDLSLWNYLCREISINHRAMHRLAGTWLLPWAKKQPFDYFLPRSKGEEDLKKRSIQMPGLEPVLNHWSQAAILAVRWPL